MLALSIIGYMFIIIGSIGMGWSSCIIYIKLKKGNSNIYKKGYEHGYEDGYEFRKRIQKKKERRKNLWKKA